MANKLYRPYGAALLAGTAGFNLNTDTAQDGVYAILVDTGVYTFNIDHAFYSQLSGLGGTEQRIITPTTTNGVFDGADVVFPSVAGTVTYEAIVLFRKNSGANTTWPLIGYLDTGVTGLPVTSNGGNITTAWHASGIFALVAQA